MALYNGTVAGTVALRKINNTDYELTKMAVEENFQRKGIAEALSYACFKKSQRIGCYEVILYSNSILKPAISLYQKLGFKHVRLELENIKDRM